MAENHGLQENQQVNTKPIFMKKRLPCCKKDIFEHAKQECLIASSYICKVKVFTKTELLTTLEKKQYKKPPLNLR